jgi:hypothetical protein
MLPRDLAPAATGGETLALLFSGGRVVGCITRESALADADEWDAWADAYAADGSRQSAAFARTIAARIRCAVAVGDVETLRSLAARGRLEPRFTDSLTGTVTSERWLHAAPRPAGCVRRAGGRVRRTRRESRGRRRARAPAAGAGDEPPLSTRRGSA